MLFHITQTHNPESCPKDVGGAKSLYNADVEGLKLVAMYGAFSEHEMYFIVEADNMKAVNKFLDPGLTRCSSIITPVVSQHI